MTKPAFVGFIAPDGDLRIIMIDDARGDQALRDAIAMLRQRAAEIDETIAGIQAVLDERQASRTFQKEHPLSTAAPCPGRPGAARRRRHRSLAGDRP
jgi:hypothetical protein